MPSKRRILWSSCIPLVLLFACTGEKIDYSRQVKPILNEKCLSCHGGVRQNGGFSLLTRELALADTDAGKPAIVPGRAQQSELYRRIISDDPELRMPQEHDPLTEHEVDVLRKWIEQGAEWEVHWAYQPLEQKEVPEISDGLALGSLAGAPGGTETHPVDRFILQRLMISEGLDQLSPAADKATLLRRVSLDLVGMPAPKSLAKGFLADEGPEAYGKLVDSLLARPEYGEHWAAMWLDIARYADSKGYERDPYRDIWRYRDWVIKAFNTNMPYDQFVTEQLAGDLLPDASDDQLIATAFHRNTSTNDEGGTDNEEYRNYAVIDRVNTTWEGLMGTAFACVQCHSHPYDPFLQEEYYQFLAFFNNTRDADTSPDYPLFRHFSRSDSLQLQDLLTWSGERMPKDQVQELARFLKTWQPVAYSIEFDSFENAALYDTKYLAFRQHGKARWPQVDLDGKDEIYLRYRTNLEGGKLDIRTKDATLLSTTMPSTKGRWKIMVLPLTKRVEGRQDLYLSYHNPHLPDDQDAGIFFDWLKVNDDGHFWSRYESAAQMDTYWDLLTKQVETTPIMIENPDDMRRTTRIFDRGNWMVQTDTVRPNVPSILPALATEDVPNRLSLAQWMMSPQHPLTARTIVNRLWAQLFGRGLVETLEDLGSQSPPPSHPELLDWLAWEFIHTHEWDMKSFLSMLVQTNTYRQRSQASEQMLAVDPDNRFLARGPRVRLSAEQLRDQALAVSGLLHRQMYGRSVMPYQPIQWTIPYSREQWQMSSGGQQHRRAVYTHWKRSNPYPAMMILDAAERNVCESRRIRTNTPLHALVTLNDPVYVEAASHLAMRMKQASPELAGQIDEGYKLALGVPTPSQKAQVFEQLYAQAMDAFAAGTSDPQELLAYCDEKDPQLAGLVVVANALMNMDEFITKN